MISVSNATVARAMFDRCICVFLNTVLATIILFLIAAVR